MSNSRKRAADVELMRMESEYKTAKGTRLLTKMKTVASVCPLHLSEIDMSIIKEVCSFFFLFSSRPFPLHVKIGEEELELQQL